MSYRVKQLRAVTVMIVVAALCAGEAFSGASDRLTPETGDVLRLAVHEIQHGRMDEYREAIKGFENVMRRQGVTFPLNAYRGKTLVRMTGAGPREAPIASYSYSTEYGSLAEALREQDAADRRLASSKDVLAAWERVEATLEARTVSMLRHRDDLSFRPSQKLVAAHPSVLLSSIHLSVRPGEENRAQDALARLATALSATASRSPVTVFEIVGKYRNREFVIFTSGTRELDLVEMTQIRKKLGRAGDELLADIWGSARKVEKRRSEIDMDLSYWP